MIDLKQIAGSGRTFIIVEAGCNFEGDLGKAKEMIRKAAEAGADAVKFQTFVAEKLASKSAEKFWEIDGCVGDTQYDEFKQMPHLSLQQYNELSNEAAKAGIIFFSTGEDEGSVDLLEKVGIPLHKISSMNITHKPLLRHIARTGKPVIVSTGASTIGEIEEAVNTIKEENNDRIALLHCISNYPTLDENVNLRMISHLRSVFPEIPIGYSDHTLPANGEGILTAAVALGAVIIEKHFTWDNSRPGYDHEISVDYDGLKNLVGQIRRVEKALGAYSKKPIASEEKARIHARRSLTANIFIPRGTKINSEMIEIKRPGKGIKPEFIDVVIGRTAQVDIEEDSPIGWDMV